MTSAPTDEDPALTTLQRRFGLATFRPGQREVIASLLAGRSALAIFPTGGGKSLCYQLPAVLLPGLTVVVSPLIALMKDQVDALTRRGVTAARLDSSLDKDEVKDIQRRVKSGELRLLYVAPERFANERFLELMRQAHISLFAVDEAHSISEWGHNFRPDYLKLARLAKEIGAERIVALTATATPAVTRTICERFAIDDKDVVVTGFYRENLELRASGVRRDDKDAALLAAIKAMQPGPGIVYVTLQKTAERVAALLQSAGHSAFAYHAGMEPEARSAVQERFMAGSGHDSGVVVATIAFGMGIDKPDVRFVVHYDLPKSLEGYSQEIGRAGRDGLPSVVHILGCRDDALVLEGFTCGDTPTRAALLGLVTELCGRGASFDVDMLALGDAHDLRPLVLRTALTHLELLGVFAQGTPFYASYQAQPLIPLAEIVARFSGEKGAFIKAIFDAGRTGRIWTRLHLDEVAKALGEDRQRVMRALEFLQEQGLVTLTVSDVRHRYTRTATDADPAALATLLHERFMVHEAREIERLKDVTALIESRTCQVNGLVAHFGERRDAPCGHCSVCRGHIVTLPPAEPPPRFEDVVDKKALGALVCDKGLVLKDARQQARFLCGLSSPATTKAKLGRHPLMGALERYRFHDVLAWREASNG